MKLNFHTTDATELHNIIAYTDRHQPDVLSLHVHPLESDTSQTRVTRGHDGRTTVVKGRFIGSVLSKMLAHYPVPVIINGQPIDQALFHPSPDVILYTHQRPHLAPSAVPTDQRIAGPDLADPEALYDHVLYSVIHPRHVLDPSDAAYRQAVATPYVFESRIHAPDVAFPHPHWTPLREYRIRHSLSITEDRPNQPRYLPGLHHGLPLLIPIDTPSPATLTELRRQREAATVHACSPAVDVSDTANLSIFTPWHPASAQRNAQAAPDTEICELSLLIPTPAAYCIAETLLSQPQHGIVPTRAQRHGHKRARLNVDAATAVFNDGSGRRIPIDARFDHPDSGFHWDLSELIVHCRITHTDGHDQYLDLTMPFLFLGNLNDPTVMTVRPSLPSADSLADHAAMAYHRWNGDGVDFARTRDAAAVIIAQCLHDQDTAFQLELQQLCNSFRPTSFTTLDAVSAVSPDGDFRITWEYIPQ